MSSFSADVLKFAQATGTKVDEACRAIKLNLFSSVIMKTRVGNPDTWKTKYPPKNYVGGRLRGNWQTTTGSPASGEIDRIDKTGNLAISDAARTVKADTVDYLTNNLPYAEIWEERDGMIATSLERVDRIIKEAAASVS